MHLHEAQLKDLYILLGLTEGGTIYPPCTEGTTIYSRRIEGATMLENSPYVLVEKPGTAPEPYVKKILFRTYI